MAGREGKSPTRTLLLVTLFAVLIMGADWIMDGTIRSQARVMVEPLIRAGYQATTLLSRSEYWTTRNALVREVSQLKSELARQGDTESALFVLRKENAELREIAQFAEGTEGVTVPITSSFMSSPYGTFTIGGGREAGIQENDIAIAGDGFVLGTVTDVTEHSAVVRAVFAPGAISEVAVGDVAFSLIGRGGGNARAEVPREASLEIGAPVLLPRLSHRSIGVIGRIESASSSAFSDVFISFPFNINAIRFVFVTR
jgi:cell shape-determining protein MreC